MDINLEGQALVVSLALDRQAEPVWLLARGSLTNTEWVSRQEICWGGFSAKPMVATEVKALHSGRQG